MSPIGWRVLLRCFILQILLYGGNVVTEWAFVPLVITCYRSPGPRGPNSYVGRALVSQSEGCVFESGCCPRLSVLRLGQRESP